MLIARVGGQQLSEHFDTLALLLAEPTVKGRDFRMRVPLASIAVCTSVTTAAFAQEQPVAPADRFSGTAWVSFTNEYISRGLVLQNQGVIVQPGVELRYQLTDHVGVFGGVWSSLSDEHTGATSDDLRTWYEFDWWVGAAASVDRWSLSAAYWEFHSPNDAFDTSHNLEFVARYDDTGLLREGFAFAPYAKVFVELDGKAGNGEDEGVYVELGVNPTFVVAEESDLPVRLTFPVFVGTGADDFYVDNDTFGFAAAGVQAAIPLDMLSSDIARWELSGGVTGYFINPSFNGSLEDERIVGFLRLSANF